jgi:8-oxo-dGTP diphosphatase/2-hydroxy-dATP diphosphatase
MEKKITTLCLVQKDDRILLGMKKRGFGKGRWNGFGGKVHKNETIEEAAKRETEEECGIKIEKLEKVGRIDFEGKNGSEISEIIEVNFFKVTDFSGEPKETEEMKPQWFPLDKIPFDLMWPDDEFWMPLFLTGKKFKGRFLFGKSDAILEKELIEVEKI